MLESDMEITLDNDNKYTVLRTIEHDGKKYALITNFKDENYVINYYDEDGETIIELIENKDEEELVANLFLKGTLEELKQYED